MLTRWTHAGWPSPWLGDPLTDAGTFGELRRSMDRMFEELDRRMPAPSTERARFVLEDAGDALELRAELPGFAESELEVHLERNTLTVRGRRDVKVPEGYVAHRRERGTIELARAFTLPCRVDSERVSATLKDGVLTVRLPKVPAEQPRRVEVKVG